MEKKEGRKDIPVNREGRRCLSDGLRWRLIRLKFSFFLRKEKNTELGRGEKAVEESSCWNLIVSDEFGKYSLPPN